MSDSDLNLFQTNNPILTLEEDSFDFREPHLNILYGEKDGQIYPPKLMKFAPAVICSPRKTGRTTQGHFIYKILQNRARDDIKYLSIDKSSIESVSSEQDFKDLLIDKLESYNHESGYFSDIIKTSNIMLRTEGIKVLFIEHAEILPKEALNWLLHGTKELEKDLTVTKLKVQIIIDGSFAVETLTSPNSRYPLPQLFPPEFMKSQQEEFVNTRFNILGKKLSSRAHDVIWEATHGDKYLTQAVCMRISNSSVRQITEDLVREHTENFIQEIGYKDNLKPLMYKAFYLLSQYYKGNEIQVRKILNNVHQRWNSYPLKIRQILYEGGVIRRVDATTVSLRAPIIKKIYKEAENRVQKAKALLFARIPLEAIYPTYAYSAQSAFQNVIENAYSGSLKGLQVGYGVKKSNQKILINVATLEDGQYIAEWEVSTSPDIPVGSNVVCLFQALETKENNRTTVLDIFPCAV